MDEGKCEIHFDAALEAIERMDPKHFKTAVKKSMRQGGNIIRKSVQQQIKTLYPGGKRYPRNPGRKSGVLKGVQYGPLYKDVSLRVWKNAKGVNVSLFSGRKSNRVIVLYWLDQGTNARGSWRSFYKVSRVVKGRKVFAESKGGYRGQLQPKRFFAPSASAATDQASQTVSDNICQNIIKAFKKELKTENE